MCSRPNCSYYIPLRKDGLTIESPAALGYTGANFERALLFAMTRNIAQLKRGLATHSKAGSKRYSRDGNVTNDSPEHRQKCFASPNSSVMPNGVKCDVQA